MKGKMTNILLGLMFFAGLSLLLYPTISSYWNSLHQSRVIRDYSNQMDSINQELCEALKKEAHAYNESLAGTRSKENMKRYEEVLDPFGTGVMGYLEIPSIGCELPIEHGTEDDILKDSVGHLSWTSLPVGGENTHSVLSGHRGLPTAELLTNIDKMVVGDTFSLHILNEELKYRVDQILVVLPEDTTALRIIKGMDLVTLVTCTPYGVNSHRLLVRGVRVPDEPEEVSSVFIENELKIFDPVVLTMGFILAAIVIIFMVMMLRDPEKARLKKNRKERRMRRKEHYRKMQQMKNISKRR